MQMYPGGADHYTQQYYAGVEEEHDYFPDQTNDYHYSNNNNAYSHQAMGKTLEKGAQHTKQNYTWGDDTDINKSFSHLTMGNTLEKGAPHANQNYWDDNNNFGNDEFQFKSGEHDYHYNNTNTNNTLAHQKMGKTLEKGASHTKQNYMWDDNNNNNNNFDTDREYHFKTGSTMQMKPNHGEDDYHYNNSNKYAHQNMGKTLEKSVTHAKQNYMWDNNNNNNYGQDEFNFKSGSTMKMKPNHQWGAPQNHDYGGYEDYNTQYSESLYENDEQHGTWNSQNNHLGLGKVGNTNKYSAAMSHAVVEKGGGYRAHQGAYMPMAKQRPYHAPVARPMWGAKGIKD